MIGKASEAKVIFYADSMVPAASLLAQYEHLLPEMFGVSQVEIVPLNFAQNTPSLIVEIVHATGSKCTRCWRYTDDVGVEGMYPEVCARCADALEKIGYPPSSNGVEGEQST